jgi:ATP adenylyltransferase/5',5'''-P-1,P-4-tetraphosphate phosphorylase II
MISHKLLDIDELRQYGGIDGDIADLTRALLVQQKKVWKQLAAGYTSLETVRVRDFHFNGFTLKVQFNPGRIISSSAKVDDKSIKERKCFLCPDNLPPDQKGILTGASPDYLILCNPYPIFPEHFTIPHIQHIPQLIDDAFGMLLDISKDLGKYYTVFYNGPRCGASAPDHLHFQAGTKGFMIIENQLEQLSSLFGKVLYSNKNIHVTAVDDSLRRFIVMTSQSKDSLISVFNDFNSTYAVHSGTDEEPMMNIIALFDHDRNRWTVIVIPRGKHRPSVYFKEEDENILLSPAAVDFGGVLITPREKDFVKLTKDHIAEMFHEVSLDRSLFENISDMLQQKLEKL